jgi:hypothetical protein
MSLYDLLQGFWDLIDEPNLNRAGRGTTKNKREYKQLGNLSKTYTISLNYKIWL